VRGVQGSHFPSCPCRSQQRTERCPGKLGLTMRSFAFSSQTKGEDPGVGAGLPCAPNHHTSSSSPPGHWPPCRRPGIPQSTRLSNASTLNKMQTHFKKAPNLTQHVDHYKMLQQVLSHNYHQARGHLRSAASSFKLGSLPHGIH
jgi:hypothetical protein